MVRTTLLCILVCFALSGCILATGPGLFAVSVATYINTDKSPSDHAVSLLTGEDCSSLEYSEGREYCVPHAPRRGPGELAYDGGPGNGQPDVGPYCYRTIGETTCYNRPDPLASEQARQR